MFRWFVGITLSVIVAAVIAGGLAWYLERSCCGYAGATPNAASMKRNAILHISQFPDGIKRAQLFA
jgi:hypothetical protein